MIPETDDDDDCAEDKPRREVELITGGHVELMRTSSTEKGVGGVTHAS